MVLQILKDTEDNFEFGPKLVVSGTWKKQILGPTRGRIFAEGQ